MQYHFDIEHIAGVKNVVADLLSRLVENHMKDHPNKFENSLVLSALTNGFILPDDSYVKILKVHNSLAGHAGLDKCLDRLKSSNVQWKYMREHVKYFIKSCPWCQKMSAI